MTLMGMIEGSKESLPIHSGGPPAMLGLLFLLFLLFFCGFGGLEKSLLLLLFV